MFCLLHDIWANFVEDEEYGYNVPEFYEWRKNDKPELFSQIPLIVIEPLLYSQIENSLMELPVELLNRVEEHAIKGVKDLTYANYCFVATDTKRIILIDTQGTNIPVKKSKLIPRHELLVWDIVKGAKPEIYEFNVKGNIDLRNKNLGLTRNERALKNIVLKAFKQIKRKGNIEEVKYWITDFNRNITNADLKEKDFSELYEILSKEIEINWSKHHEEVGRSLVKGRKTLEKQWISEVKNSKVKKS
jgi:hypothetical protein